MAREVLREQLISSNTPSVYKNSDALLDISSMTTLLTESNDTMSRIGVDMERHDAMNSIFNDDQTARMYIDSLAEGLDPEDTHMFKVLSENMLDAIVGRGWYANRATLSALSEDNNSAGFLPKAKLVFPMFRFCWPRLHVREITTVIPMDNPEIVRYFFHAVAKNLDNSIVPLPSYSPIGNGQTIGSYTTPKEVNVPSSTDLLADIGADSSNTHLEKRFTIIGWKGIDPNGGDVSDEDSTQPMMYVTDADGKFTIQIDVDPKKVGANTVLDVVSGFVDFERGIVSISSSRSSETNGKVTSLKCVCAATSTEHNIAPRITFDSKQVKFQAKDIQLQSEWSEQYIYDMNKRTGMDVISELTCIMGQLGSRI